MKKILVCMLLLVASSLLAGGRGSFVWGVTGLANEAAVLQGSMASVDGLLKANPLGEADTPGLSQVLLARAAEVRANLSVLAGAIDTTMEVITQEQRQAVLDEYCVFMVELRDLKTAAEGRFLDAVSLELGDTYRQYGGRPGFVWGVQYGLIVPPLKDIDPTIPY